MYDRSRKSDQGRSSFGRTVLRYRLRANATTQRGWRALRCDGSSFQWSSDGDRSSEQAEQLVAGDCHVAGRHLYIRSD